jgi:hypothetical protein
MALSGNHEKLDLPLNRIHQVEGKYKRDNMAEKQSNEAPSCGIFQPELYIHHDQQTVL